MSLQAFWSGRYRRCETVLALAMNVTGANHDAPPRRQQQLPGMYQANPGTVYFVGYGVSHGAPDLFAPSDMLRTTDGFFVKPSYLFRQ